MAYGVYGKIMIDRDDLEILDSKEQQDIDAVLEPVTASVKDKQGVEKKVQPLTLQEELNEVENQSHYTKQSPSVEFENSFTQSHV